VNYFKCISAGKRKLPGFQKIHGNKQALPEVTDSM
jgi:hypothetical protein